jgi:hypothetical protein
MVVKGGGGSIDASGWQVERVGGNVYLVSGHTAPGMIVRSQGRETNAGPDGAFRLQISSPRSKRPIEISDDGQPVRFIISPTETPKSCGGIKSREGTIAHQHDHQARTYDRTGRLKLALGLTFVYMFAEAIGGWLTNSLALIADAGHMLTDVAALSLTLCAIWFGSRPATAKKTFGYYRLEILAAFVNGIALVLLSIWVIYEAFQRWQSPPVINGLQLTFIAAGGLS